MDFKGHGKVFFFPEKIAWSFQLSQIITGIFFYSNNYDRHVVHSSLLLICYKLSQINAERWKAIMLHLKYILLGANHLTFKGGYGWFGLGFITFGDRIIFPDIQLYAV